MNLKSARGAGREAGPSLVMSDSEPEKLDATGPKRVKTEPAEREEVSCSAVAISEEYDRAQLPDLLRVYYTWLFPYDRYYEWLQYGECTL